MRPTMAWGFAPEEARERWRRRSRRQTRASRPDDRSQPVIPEGFAEYPARVVHATNQARGRGLAANAGRWGHGEPGRAPCDAQPGCQSAINKPARSSHKRGTAPPLLDHREHPSDERESARARGGVDFGDHTDGTQAAVVNRKL